MSRGPREWSPRSYRATYKSGKVRVETRFYPSRREALDALEKGMRKRGIEFGVLHPPGIVAGDSKDCGSRAGGLVCVLRK